MQQIKTTCTRVTCGTCVVCHKKPAVFHVLKLCDDCFAELNKIPMPDEKDAQAMNEYARKRREFLVSGGE